MITPKEFVEVLRERGFKSFTGVPCSFFQAAINCVIDDPKLRYTIVPNEGAALAFAAGAYLAGSPTAVLIQNSGFGNLINPLTSLNMIYHLPALIFISGRAYGVPDEPQHEIIGKTMGGILDAMGVRHMDLPDESLAYEEALESVVQRMGRDKQPFVFFVRKGALDTYSSKKKNGTRFPLKRIEAIQAIAKALTGDEYVIATTGKPSRELFSVWDRSKNFYMQGSMGHASSIGLGVALHHPQKKVVVLDGDGAILMHLGILSSIGHYKPRNFYHIILDNESYETTGDQDTTSPTTDLKAVAKACGYRFSEEAATETEIKERIKAMLKTDGPCLLRVKINRAPTLAVPRISSKYSSEKIAANFQNSLQR